MYFDNPLSFIAFLFLCVIAAGYCIFLLIQVIKEYKKNAREIPVSIKSKPKSIPTLRIAPGDKWSQYIDGRIITKTISKVDYDPKRKVWSIAFEEEDNAITT